MQSKLLLYVIRPFRDFVKIDGRSDRIEMFINIISFYLVIFLGFILGDLIGVKWLAYIGLAFAFISLISCMIRRLHDQDKSGFFIAITLIPGVGFLILIVILFFDGTKGHNQYGPEP